MEYLIRQTFSDVFSYFRDPFRAWLRAGAGRQLVEPGRLGGQERDVFEHFGQASEDYSDRTDLSRQLVTRCDQCRVQICPSEVPAHAHTAGGAHTALRERLVRQADPCAGLQVTHGLVRDLYEVAQKCVRC